MLDLLLTTAVVQKLLALGYAAVTTVDTYYARHTANQSQRGGLAFLPSKHLSLVCLILFVFLVYKYIIVAAWKRKEKTV